MFLLFHLTSENAVRYLNFMATALSVYAMVISSIFSASLIYDSQLSIAQRKHIVSHRKIGNKTSF